MLTCDLRFVEEELRVICDESGRFLVRKEGLLCQLDLLGGGGSSDSSVFLEQVLRGGHVVEQSKINFIISRRVRVIGG